MKESLHGLLNLQQVDDELDKLQRHKSDYPARIAELEQLIAELKRNRESKRAELTDHEANLRHFSKQLEAAREKVTKQQERSADIKTNREYDAYQQEMMSLHHSIDEYTAEQKRASDEIERLTSLLEEQETEFRSKLDGYEAEIADLRERTQSIDDEVAKALEKRKQVVAAVPVRVASMYERVRRGKRKAVVRVVREACSGCWTNLPPQRINELRLSHRIVVCDGCGRILVWDDRNEEAA